MVSRSAFVLAVLFLPSLASAAVVPGSTDASAAPKFYRDVLPILQQNCQTCHRRGGANLSGALAPMALTSFEETRPWAVAIARAVATRRMPPWFAAAEFHGVFANERTLTQEQIDTLVAWADQGAPRGESPDAADSAAPLVAGAAPSASQGGGEGWSIGEPDLVLTMPEPVHIEDGVDDLYITQVAKISNEQLPTVRYIKAVEFHPGSPAVHHILSPPLGGMAPGADPMELRDGFGIPLRPGTGVPFQVHYHKEPGPGTEVWDRSSLGVVLYPEGYEPRFRVEQASLGNTTFRIPPRAPHYEASAEERFEHDVLLLSLQPHMHLRGKSARYVATYPDGSMETLLVVPHYDFNWQTTYTFAKPKRLPAGTRLAVTMAWDNSSANPSNPDPDAEVTFGPKSSDEMLFGFASFALADPDAAVELDPRRLERVVGRYRVHETGDGGGQLGTAMDLGFNGETLTIRFPETPGVEKMVFPMRPLTPERFTLEVAGIEIQLVEGSDDRFLFQRGGSELEVSREP